MARASGPRRRSNWVASSSARLLVSAGVAAAGRDQEPTRIAQYTQQTQFVGGRSFYQNGKQWIDAAVQKLKDAKRVRVQFGSQDYFDLLARKPQTQAWLALGQNVQFALGDTVYEVYEQ